MTMTPVVNDALALYRATKEAKMFETRQRARLKLHRLLAVMNARALREYTREIENYEGRAAAELVAGLEAFRNGETR